MGSGQQHHAWMYYQQPKVLVVEAAAPPRPKPHGSHMTPERARRASRQTALNATPAFSPRNSHRASGKKALVGATSLVCVVDPGLQTGRWGE